MDYYSFSPAIFVLRIFESFSQLFLINSLSGVQITMKKTFVTSVFLAIIFELVKVIIPQYLTSVITALFILMIAIFILKIQYKKAIISCLATGIAIAIIDCIVSSALLKLLHFSTFLELSQSEFFSAIGKFIISVIVLIIATVFNFTLNKSMDKSDNIKNTMGLVTIGITFALLFSNLTMILYYHDNVSLPNFVIAINIVAIIAMFALNMFHIQDGLKHIQAEEELMSEKTYNKTLQDLVDGLRTFKHDYNNTLQTIYGFLFTDKISELKEFFNQILDESRAITALDKLNPELFRNPSLLGLVTAKFEYARKNNVTMNFEIYADLDELDMKTYDFTRILGIFLDNAIEAAAGSERKIVNFYVVEKNKRVNIEISNSFSDTGLRVEDINKKGVSSKGEKRGLGLYKVSEIVKKYPRVIHETRAQNNMFLQKLVIEKD